MTLKELRAIQDRVRLINGQLARLQIDTEMQQKPEYNPDKLKAERQQLTDEYRAAIRRLSSDNYIERSIYLHTVKGYTWRKVAHITTGRLDAADALRQAAGRYTW